MIKLIVIDFDDTLSLTEEACFFLENETAIKMGYKPMTRETHQMNWGKPLDQAIVERIPGVKVEEFLEELFILHMDHAKSGTVDVISNENFKFLDELKSRNKKLAILTSRNLAEVKHLVHEDHPINRRIEKFYHRDNSQYVKPDPRVFYQVLHDFNMSPDETVYLGDSLGDAISAKGAGLHFIAVLESGLKNREDFKDLKVDFFATTLPEALNYILNN